jgi:hypothetical protein
VRRRIAIVGHQALPGGLEGPRGLRLARCPTLERALEVREGEAGMCPRKGRVEAHRRGEELLGAIVVVLVEAVHVPQAAVMRLPGVQRARRPHDRAVALDRLDLARDGRDDPVADLLEHEESVVQLVVEDLRPDDAGGAVSELDGNGKRSPARSGRQRRN